MAIYLQHLGVTGLPNEPFNLISGLFYHRDVASNQCNADAAPFPGVLMVDLGHADQKPTTKSIDNGSDQSAFLLQRVAGGEP